VGIEIERKFLLKELPVAELQNANHEEIQQGYLILEADRELRIRRKEKLFFLTEKKGTGLCRDEYEILINEKIFDVLWPMTRKLRLEKTRATFTLNGQQLELDVYQGALKPLMILEVEFETKDQANAWSSPWFAGAEVTEDKRYKNSQLAKEGNPQKNG
jgi:adenylate cyclase